jgi:hypothetical protein
MNGRRPSGIQEGFSSAHTWLGQPAPKGLDEPGTSLDHDPCQERRLMRLRYKSAVVFGAIAMLAGGVLLWPRDHGARRMAEETRRLLRQQGFRTEIAEFNLRLDPVARSRASALTNAGQACRDFRDWPLVMLMMPVGSNTARVTWQEERLETRESDDVWPQARRQVRQRGELLDQACKTVLSGPIRFEPTIGWGSQVLLPYLAGLKQLAEVLALRTALELRDGHRQLAWTNALAVTRLVTAWEPEPVDVAHLVRFRCVEIAQRTLWEVLQASSWTDDQLAALQREWRGVDFFRGLPEASALERTSLLGLCEAARHEPYGGGFASVLSELREGATRSPEEAFQMVKGLVSGWPRALRYRKQGSYEDERALMLYFRERELERREVLSHSTWSAIRSLPGVTNTPAFEGSGMSGIVSLVHSRQLSLYWTAMGAGVVGRAAEAETRRCLIVAAIALQRYWLAHRTFPESLSQLVPIFLSEIPQDFMDGQSLRYRRMSDGRFLLYSTGLDCRDDSGRMPERDSTLKLQQPADLVWPLPATASELEPERWVVLSFRIRRYMDAARLSLELLTEWGFLPPLFEETTDEMPGVAEDAEGP